MLLYIYFSTIFCNVCVLFFLCLTDRSLSVFVPLSTMLIYMGTRNAYNLQPWLYCRYIIIIPFPWTVLATTTHLLTDQPHPSCPTALGSRRAGVSEYYNTYPDSCTNSTPLPVTYGIRHRHVTRTLGGAARNEKESLGAHFKFLFRDLHHFTHPPTYLPIFLSSTYLF